MSFAPDAEPFAKPESLLRVPVGLASPLWGLFAGAAVSGAAWWWMTRWARPANLEAMFGAPAKFEAAVAPEMTERLMAVTETADTALEAASESIVEAAAEARVAALPGAPAEPVAVGGEAAPISAPIFEAAPAVQQPTTKARKPAAEPKLD